MKLTTQDLHILCSIAIKAAQKAGKLINSYTNKHLTVKNKKGTDSLAAQVVTEVDVKAQDIILEALSPTLSQYDLALLTEESEDDHSRFEKDYFWCIDPLDGTLAFTEKTPGYAVSIALVSKSGESQLGVVFDPVTQILYRAVKGEGAFKNELPWNPGLSFEQNDRFTFHMDRTFQKHPEFESIKTEIQQFTHNEGLPNFEIQNKAGGVLNAIWVLNNPGCYFKLPKQTPGGGSLWDFAASACILKEAGAYARSFDGSPLDLNRNDSTFMNHKGVLFASNTEIAEQIKNLLS
uniref:3'(2'),5'-bisphosphate nucleotidase CysQ family protein n=1 Tax=uncultured Draconibacterium sp. TaxID=1573823 RepID=UPI0032169C83